MTTVAEHDERVERWLACGRTIEYEAEIQTYHTALEAVRDDEALEAVRDLVDIIIQTTGDHIEPVIYNMLMWAVLHGGEVAQGTFDQHNGG